MAIKTRPIPEKMAVMTCAMAETTELRPLVMALMMFPIYVMSMDEQRLPDAVGPVAERSSTVKHPDRIWYGWQITA